MITKLAELIDLLKTGPGKKLVVACGDDPHTIGAVARAVKTGSIKALMVGNEAAIKKVATEHSIDPAIFEIVPEPDKRRAVKRAVKIVREKKGDYLMKGLLDTAEYMRAILDKEEGLMAPGKTLSHVTVIEVATYPKLLIVSDVAVLPNPDLGQKVAMVNYCVETAHCLKNDKPKVAMIAAVEKVNPKLVSTLEAAVVSKMAERGQIPGCIIDGPMALDVAINKESADIKGVKSPVAGDADILIFHDLEAGNAFFKSLTYFANARLAALVAGTSVPCVLTSRGDPEESKFYSVVLGALLAK